MTETVPQWSARSYAKINLGLNVLEKLATGYHRIETGYCFIDWKDRITLQPSDANHLEMSDPSIPTDQNNLIWKAFEIWENYVGAKQAYSIHVDKSIPAGAGLGGGSSNAATLLRMLNKAEGTGLSPDELADLSRTIGADVPFFIKGMPGIGTGLGQDIEPDDIQPDHWIVTVFPEIHSSTAEAYQLAESVTDHEFSVSYILNEIPADEWIYFLGNDLEPGVFQLHNLVGNLKDQLMELGAIYSSMSGSGSAVYGLFEQDFVAFDALKTFNDLGFQATITKPKFIPDYGIFRVD